MIDDKDLVDFDAERTEALGYLYVDGMPAQLVKGPTDPFVVVYDHKDGRRYIGEFRANGEHLLGGPPLKMLSSEALEKLTNKGLRNAKQT